MNKIASLLGLSLGLGVAAPIDHVGALSVQNGKVVGKSGQPANLRGMSFFWNIAPEAHDYYNANVVNWLADDWHANLVRAAMAVEDGSWNAPVGGGYMFNPTGNQAMVETIVDAAIAKGIYVIIDWHSHWSTDPSQPQRLTKAKEFFTAMATKYGSYPNVIYEVFNEPGQGEADWPTIKKFDQEVVDAIRAVDPDNLIIVGTPQYSSAVHVATANPLPSSYTNIAYSFHMYASDPAHDKYMDQANTALSRGHALFVSEWGVSQANGGGSLDQTRINNWLSWMNTNGISWAAWSISNKNESSSSLKSSASTSGNWTASDLSETGTWYRNTLRGLNQPWDAVPLQANSIEHSYKIHTLGNQLFIETSKKATFKVFNYKGELLKEINLEKDSDKAINLDKGYYVIKVLNYDQTSTTENILIK